VFSQTAPALPYRRIFFEIKGLPAPANEYIIAAIERAET
jgi:hypothetical protein